MGVPGNPPHITRVIIAEIIEQQEGIMLTGLTKAKTTMQMHPRPLHRGAKARVEVTGRMTWDDPFLELKLAAVIDRKVPAPWAIRTSPQQAKFFRRWSFILVAKISMEEIGDRT